MSFRDRLSRTTAMPVYAKGLRDGYLIARRALRRVGFDLVFANYDSPIPDLVSLPAGFFERPSPMRGIAFDTGAQMDFVEGQLAEFCREWAPPRTEAEAGPHRFHLANATYESVDAELLYAIVRRFAPRRIVELGSGYLDAHHSRSARPRRWRSRHAAHLRPLPVAATPGGVAGHAALHPGRRRTRCSRRS